MFTVWAISLLPAVTTSAQRGRAVGMWSGGFLLGGISGPALGGVVTGISLRLPFFIYSGPLAVAGRVALVLPRATPLANRSAAAGVRPVTLRAALHNSAYRAALAAN